MRLVSRWARAAHVHQVDGRTGRLHRVMRGFWFMAWDSSWWRPKEKPKTNLDPHLTVIERLQARIRELEEQLAERRVHKLGRLSRSEQCAEAPR